MQYFHEPHRATGPPVGELYSFKHSTLTLPTNTVETERKLTSLDAHSGTLGADWTDRVTGPNGPSTGVCNDGRLD